MSELPVQTLASLQKIAKINPSTGPMQHATWAGAACSARGRVVILQSTPVMRSVELLAISKQINKK